jgi:hypothetical protein
VKSHGPPFCDFVITTLALRGVDVSRQLFLRSMELVGKGCSKAGMNDLSKRRLCLPYTSYLRDRAIEHARVKHRLRSVLVKLRSC